MAFLTKTSTHYDWQYEVISRIERDGKDPGDTEVWDEYLAEVRDDEEAEAKEAEAIGPCVKHLRDNCPDCEDEEFIPHPSQTLSCFI